jgi:hypothetical protein
MHELRTIIKRMRPTNSTGLDTISMRVIKESIEVLAPALLNIVNTSIVTNTFPRSLLNSRVIPILKPLKDPSIPKSFRGINLLPVISKIIENAVLDQMKDYLSRHSLIPPQHNGSIPGHSTTTTAITLIDMWSRIIEIGDDGVVLQLDQSAAYDVVCHAKLLLKLGILGFDKGTIEWFRSFMTDRQQTVVVDGKESDPLPTGQHSVTQGSVLSCLLYLIYMLDFPLLFHDQQHDSEQDFKCDQPTASSFVDDLNTTVVVRKAEYEQHGLQTKMTKTIEMIESYMDANELALNRDKTKIFGISKNPTRRNELVIPAEPNDIRHTRNINILGIICSDDLKWNSNLAEGSKSLIKQLATRNTTLRKLVSHADPVFSLKLANAIFQSKLLYGIQVWGTAPKYLLKQLQVQQNNAARITLGYKSLRWSQTTLLKSMKWLSIESLVLYHSAKLIHQVIHTRQPRYLHQRLVRELAGITRSSTDNKLGPKPADVGGTIYTKHTFMSYAFDKYQNIPGIITAIISKNVFSTRLKRYLTNNDDVPSINDPYFRRALHPDTISRLLIDDEALFNRRHRGGPAVDDT